MSARYAPFTHEESGTGATPPRHPTTEESILRAHEFAASITRRRSIRDFSDEPIPGEVIDSAIRAASSAPSGANLQPWRFVVLTDPARKRALREQAEAAEREFYEQRAPQEWLDALSPLGTDWRKPFLEKAPAVIVVFEVHRGPDTPRPYYVKESVGIAVGLLLACLHQAGLATLTHTPSPMRFLNTVCERPAHERPFLVIPVGHPAPDAQVPDIVRKPLDAVLVRI
ncbi:nitroreductase family protein [Streptomyces sp. S.PB5]|uniref:nitroreductase family protein n=1 Tax=Streptomyces sp. S.PB5 TaxID=3020844 RepID=UPI0025B008B5|nr:nitroreductase family protein [Streptomyces sp. S.PB5]MDN3022759.1 nitroreductase family protein [Streptomyces sp. S.PB5]